jgi:hypothetical protein
LSIDVNEPNIEPNIFVNFDIIYFWIIFGFDIELKSIAGFDVTIFRYVCPGFCLIHEWY